MAAAIPTVKATMLGFGNKNTSDCLSAVYDLASTGLAKCSKIYIDNSVCGVYNTFTRSKCRRVTCQIGARTI